jgi:hypothetical protein
MIGRLTGRGSARAHREFNAQALPRRCRTGGQGRATALEFLGQVAASWDLDDPQAELALKWAALHEIGLTRTAAITTTAPTC